MCGLSARIGNQLCPLQQRTVTQCAVRNAAAGHPKRHRQGNTMDPLLESLKPLASLLSRAADPSAAARDAEGALRFGHEAAAIVALRRHIGRDADHAAAVLQHAGVTTHGQLTPDGVRTLAQAEALAL